MLFSANSRRFNQRSISTSLVPGFTLTMHPEKPRKPGEARKCGDSNTYWHVHKISYGIKAACAKYTLYFVSPEV